MTRDWNRVRELFLSVCDMEESDQRRVLGAAQGIDDGTRLEVEALLRSSARTESRLDADLHAANPGSPSGSPVADPMLGCRIGQYSITAQLARGGMGAVYRAQRVDDEFQLEVAIKLMRRELVDDETVRRFRVERQALALLDHPGIARLLDGGITDEGLPYLVMELVEGDTICTWADRRRLDIPERLRLFQQVCSAVEFAHRNLIVHRDLKPGNILIDEAGRARLLDFGVAKITENEGNHPSLDTIPGQLPFTPDYASPEQLRGEPLTTATDVYSLGVVLYELLTGQRPFSPKSRRPLGVGTDQPTPIAPSVAVVRGAPTAPTGTPAPLAEISVLRNTSPERLSRRLHGDLDNIVFAAMHDEPQRRYSSVQALHEDIDRYLERRPVHAHPDSLSYRTARFVRRHVLGVFFAAAAVIGVVLGVSLVLYQAGIASEQRDAANATKTFLIDLLASASPENDGRDVTVRQLLGVAAERIEREFADRPDLRASLLWTVGGCFVGMGDYSTGAGHLRAALGLFRELPDANERDVVECSCSLSHALYQLGELDQAESLLHGALRRSWEQFGQSAVTAQVENNLGAILAATGRYTEAKGLYASALEIRREVLGDDDLAVAETLNNLAGIARRERDHAAAINYTRRALSIRENALDSDHPLVIQSRANLAVVLHQGGELEAAEEFYEAALADSATTLGETHTSHTAIAANYAMLLLTQGRPARAEPLLRQHYEAVERALPPTHAEVIRAGLRLGRCRIELKAFAAAERCLLDTHSRAEQSGRSDQIPDIARALSRLYEAWGRGGEAARWRRG